MSEPHDLVPTGLGMAGWLFADVLLALAMIFLLSVPGGGNSNAVASVASIEATGTSIEATSRAASIDNQRLRTVLAATADAIKSVITPTPLPKSALPSSNPTPSPTACTKSMSVVELTPIVAARQNGNPPSDAKLLSELERLLKGKRVGVMYTYGHHPQIGQAQGIASEINSLLRGRRWEKDYPGLAAAITEATRFKDGGNVLEPYGQVDFEIYLLADEC
jgi:hypothetical protein